ncbi:hypothetical protein ACOMHN_028232 [Nucella lapillus]
MEEFQPPPPFQQQREEVVQNGEQEKNFRVANSATTITEKGEMSALSPPFQQPEKIIAVQIEELGEQEIAAAEKEEEELPSPRNSNAINSAAVAEIIEKGETSSSIIDVRADRIKRHRPEAYEN